MELDERGCVATTHADLIAAIMDPKVPKTEREHAAGREIEKLREQINTRDKTLDAVIEVLKDARDGNMMAMQRSMGKLAALHGE